MQITIEHARLIYRQQNPQYQKTFSEVIQANRSDVEVTEGRPGLGMEHGGGGGQMGVVIVEINSIK